MSRNRILQAVLCLIFLAGAVFAQTTTTTGEINGTVSDTSGAVLPGVTVTATNLNTGLTRTVYTDANGSYTIPLLPPGSYRVVAELAGLGEARREVRVFLGQAANTRFSLNPQIAEEITVTAEAPLIDTTQSGSTSAVTQEEISNLPILGRDFKDLVLLTPGVSNSFGGRVSLNGARGMSTDYNIDGANANSDFFGEERGGTAAPYVFSQAAIKEFQVIRSSYSVEYARGGGGTMNAITKSGTNAISGEAFWYRRDQEWADERTLPEGTSEFFDPRDADQYGFAVGGPIMRDRLFYFVNGDFQKIEEPFTMFDFRQSSQFAALPADVRQNVVSRLEGLFGPLDQQFAYDTRENQDTWLGKIDWNIGAANHVNVRWNYSDFNNFPSESSGTFSNQGDEYNTVNSWVAQADSIISPSIYNFALLQYSLEERPINPLTTAYPQFYIGGLQSGNVYFGQRDFLPNGTDEEKWELKDTLSWMVGEHQIRAGFNYLTVDIANLFVRDLAGDFQFNTPQQFLAGTPARFEQGFGLSPVTAFDFNQYGLFLMDTWRPTPRLTLDYGVRWDGQSTPKPIRNVYESTNPEFDDNFESDSDNFAPRVGFAYDLGGNGRSVIRGGVGQYYNFIPTILYAQPVQQIGGLFSNYSFVCSATLQCPTYPNLFTEAQLGSFNPSAVLDIAIVDPDLEAQESVRGSLGYEQQLGSGYSFEVEGVYADHSKQQRFVNVNAVPTGRMYGNLVEYRTSGAGRPYSNFSNVRKHVTDAEGEYTSATVGFRKIAVGGSNLSWLAHYTWSEAIDQDSNSRSTSTSFSWDPYNPEISEGPADYDTTHKVVASATYELPYGFLVSGIFNWRTGQPYTRNIFYSGGAGTLTGIARMGVNVSVFVDESGNVIDITQANGFTPDQFAAFLDERGARLLGRNTENQPDFMNLDMRIAKSFNLPAGLQLELIGEIFNVLNETNMFIITNDQNEFTMRMGSGADAGKFLITRNANFQRERGLDFNSPPRQYQAAVKLRF
jgi:hypothetical protein